VQPKDWRLRIEDMLDAITAIPEDVRMRHNAIPWDQIRGMRNVVVHEYAGIRVDTVWQTIHEELPDLAKSLGEMLDGRP